MVSQGSLPIDVLKALRKFADEHEDIRAGYHNPSGEEREHIVQFVTTQYSSDLDTKIIELNAHLTRQNENLDLTILQRQISQKQANHDLGRRIYLRN